MYRTLSLHLKLIEDLEQWTLPKVLERFSTRFDERTSFGFVETESYDGVVSSVVVYRSIVARTQFDPIRNELVSQPQVVFEHVPFRVDYKAGLLEASLGGRRLAKLVSVIGRLFDFGITIQDMHVNLNAFIGEMDRAGRAYTISKVAVTNFRPGRGLTGRFVAAVYEQGVARDLIREYDLDVTDLNVELTAEGSRMTWRLSSTGAIAIRAEEDLIEEELAMLRETLVKCKDA